MAEIKTFGGVSVRVKEGEVSKGKDRIITKDDELLLQKIAVCLNLKQPVLLEGESGLGKTEMIDHISEQCKWPISYLNCHDMEPDQIMGSKTLDNTTQSGFGYKPGALPIGIKEGHLTVLDEYNFIRGETRAVLTEPLDALLRQKSSIKNTFNDGELIPVHKFFRLIALQNPPGGVYGNREVLDPPQLSRFVYIRLSPMSRNQKLARAQGFFGTKLSPLPKKDYITVLGDPTQFQDEENVQYFTKKYVEFTIEFDELVRLREIGSTYEQPIYTSFQREFDRVKAFMFRYPQETLQNSFVKAVRFYFSNKLIERKDLGILNDLVIKYFLANPERNDDQTCSESDDSKEGE